MRARLFITCLLVASGLPVPLLASTSPVTGAAQSTGVKHTLRQIPEACVRLEGVFTGDPAKPYAMELVRLGPPCQPRARYDGRLTKAMATPGTGWRQTQVIRIPSANCPGLVVDFEVWQRPGAAAPRPDGQGQTRVYLEEAQRDARSGQLARLPGYAVRTRAKGSCAP